MSGPVDEKEAAMNLPELVVRVMNGERIIITKDGQAVAMLGPVQDPPAKRVLGADHGRVVIHGDFDEPLTS